MHRNYFLQIPRQREQEPWLFSFLDIMHALPCARQDRLFALICPAPSCLFRLFRIYIHIACPPSQGLSLGPKQKKKKKKKSQNIIPAACKQKIRSLGGERDPRRNKECPWDDGLQAYRIGPFLPAYAGGGGGGGGLP